MFFAENDYCEDIKKNSLNFQAVLTVDVFYSALVLSWYFVGNGVLDIP